MASNLSLANKYRPQVFEDVLGQEAIVSALRGKLKDGKLPRTSMYCGAHGSGKTTLARIVAKAVNCENPVDGNPCCKCQSCMEIDSGMCPDVIELDAASHNKVEDAENIIKKVEFLPQKKKKVVILDEMHMLTKEAQNKLLKMVEEPPEHVIFIFCTTEEEKVLPTILSRCNKFTFRAIGTDDILSNLRKISDLEHFEYEDDALKMIAKASDGHARDSLSVLEQLSSEKITTQRVAQALGLSKDEDIFFILQAVLSEDYKQVEDSLEEVILKGNLQKFLRRVVEILCYLWAFDENVKDNETEEFRETCKLMRERLSPERCMEWIDTITKTLRDNRGLGLDLAVRFCFLAMLDYEKKENRIDEMQAQIEELKKVISGGIVSAPLSNVPMVQEEEEKVASFEVTEVEFDEPPKLEPVIINGLRQEETPWNEKGESSEAAEPYEEPVPVSEPDDGNDEFFAGLDISCDEEEVSFDASQINAMFEDKPTEKPVTVAKKPEAPKTSAPKPTPVAEPKKQEPTAPALDDMFADMPGIIIHKEEEPKPSPAATQPKKEKPQLPDGYQACAEALKVNQSQPVGQLKAFKSFMSVFEDFM